MSVNALGVNAYTKVERFSQQNRPEPARSAEDQVKQAEVSGKSPEAVKITIPQKSGAGSSALAVSSDMSLTDILTPEEKQAIDELFAKYDFPQNERAGYSAFGEKTTAAGIGRKVDFKV